MDVNTTWVEETILENWWVTTWDLSTALELPTETVNKSVHEELGHHNLSVCAGYQDVWWKSTEIKIFKVLLHIFNGFKKEISSWNPQWQAMRQHHFTQQTKQAGIKWKQLTSPTAKKCNVSVCWKSSDIYILECKSHPCWVHVSGHKWMPTVTQCVDCVKLFTEWDLDICLGCDLATQQATLGKHGSDTNIAFTSLGTSGPSTLQSWPSHIRLPLVWTTEATCGRTLVTK